MRSTAAVLCVWFCYQVLGGEIPDVTTIYEIGRANSVAVQQDAPPFPSDDAFPLFPLGNSHQPHSDVSQSCINGITGHVHSRTNALGMGLTDEKNNTIDEISVDIPNITLNAMCQTNYSCTQWNMANGQTEISVLKLIGKSIINTGKAYPIDSRLTLNIHDMSYKTYIFFTQGSKSLEDEKIYFVLKFHGKSYGSTPDIYFDCIINQGYCESSRYFEGHRDGISTSFCCYSHYTDFSFSYSDDTLTFDFTGGVKIYRGIGERETLIVDWNYNGYSDIKYFSVSPTELQADANSVSLALQGFDVDPTGIVSPTFTPKSDDICLAILLYSTNVSVFSSELEVLAMGSNEDQEYILGTVQNVKSGWNVKVVNQKLRDLTPISVKVRKSGTSDVTIVRISSCNPDGEEVLELSTPTSVCLADLRFHQEDLGSIFEVYSSILDNFDHLEKVSDVDKKCWNGGVLTSAGCACPPGFTGPKCEIGCGRNRFGQDCGGLCSLHDDECRGLLMCTKFTRCQCAPGYTGDDCSQACSPGWYGNNCSQRCNHCAGNEPCDIYTGECTSCEVGYLAPHCKLVSAYYGSKPEVTSPAYGTILVSFDPNNYITVAEPPKLYQIQFRKKGEQWQVYTTKSLKKSSDTLEQQMKISEKIEGLNIGSVYEVRVLMLDENLMKYDGDLVQVAEVLSKCDVPSFYNYSLSSTSNMSSITFSWRYAAEDEYTCPLEAFEVSWKEGWKWPKKYAENENFTLTGLRPGAVIKFRVRAQTTGGPAPYSKIAVSSTKLTVYPPVQNLHVESKQSTSVKISWDPPIGYENKKLRYTVLYKCVDRPACSPGCENVSEGQLTQEGSSITLSPLLPFTMYLVTVRAEGGTESSVIVGTTEVVPTEVPVLSAQRPVRTNTSLTVFWEQGRVCTGFLLGYNYQLTKASEDLKILASGFTKETSVTFHNLTASTEYVVRVFVNTVASWNPLRYLAINVNTSATVPEAVRNLTVYKRGRGMLGLRWAEPRASYGPLKSFTVTHSLGQSSVSHTVEPTHCVAWPHLYCLTIDGLRSNRLYNLSVSARNSEVAEDGEVSFVSAVTKESAPSAPVNLKVTNSSSTSIELEWDHPDMANGVLRSFLISVEESEKYDQETCCQEYPLIETSVTEELQKYKAEVSGLHPASTYFVSVSGKTVGLGLSQTLTASTRPPHAPFLTLPTVLPSVADVSWLPQDNLQEVNNSDIYTALIRAHLLLAVPNDTQPALLASESGITDPKLDSLLKKEIGKPFYFITEYTQDDDVDVAGPLEDSNSTWGQPPVPTLIAGSYLLVAAQVLEYSGTYNVDLRYSQPFTLT